MLVLLSVAIFQMSVGGLSEKITLSLYNLGFSEGLAQSAGEVIFIGILLVPSIVVLSTVGVLLWTGEGESTVGPKND